LSKSPEKLGFLYDFYIDAISVGKLAARFLVFFKSQQPTYPPDELRTMRLSPFEQQIIKQTIYTFDKQAKIILFGSRTDETARGGDIDLLIISQQIKRDQLGEIRWQLWQKLGEQKIDMILSDEQLLNTFASIAFEQGIKL